MAFEIPLEDFYRSGHTFAPPLALATEKVWPPFFENPVARDKKFDPC